MQMALDKSNFYHDDPSYGECQRISVSVSQINKDTHIYSKEGECVKCNQWEYRSSCDIPARYGEPRIHNMLTVTVNFTMSHSRKFEINSEKKLNLYCH